MGAAGGNEPTGRSARLIWACGGSPELCQNGTLFNYEHPNTGLCKWQPDAGLWKRIFGSTNIPLAWVRRWDGSWSSCLSSTQLDAGIDVPVWICSLPNSCLCPFLHNTQNLVMDRRGSTVSKAKGLPLLHAKVLTI